MESRIPLSIIFSAEGKRHAIPHRTFRVPVSTAHSDDRTAKADAAVAKEGLAFFRYLDSNDTRMPSHPHLSAYSQPAEEYETYVGEDIWESERNHGRATAPAATSTGDAPQSAKEVQDDATSEGSADVLPPVPAFHDIVNWVHRVMEEETWARDGVVLCGRYVVADDAAWAVPSRSPTLYTTREVFLLMRNSCKFLRDIHAQLRAVQKGQDTADQAAPCASSNTHVTRLPGASALEFTLAKALAGPGACEMRAILPYPLRFSPTKQEWETAETVASSIFAGIGQRMTDACFPSLMAWSEGEHDEHFRVMQRRLEQAALLERTLEVDPQFASRLVARFYKHKNICGAANQAIRHHDPPHRASDSSHDDDPQHDPESDVTTLTLLLSVDVLFEGPSLPIYILSAKARVFELAPLSDDVWEDLLGPEPWSLWTPLLKDKDMTSTGAAAVAGESGILHSSGEAEHDERDDVDRGASSDSDSEAEEEEEDSNSEAAMINFFRMFRDVAHWNQYVGFMVERLRRAAAEEADRLDNHTTETNKPSRNMQHYCVIASSGEDLVTCADTLTKRGLPLELMHPELLELNEDAAGFLKMLRDGLFKKPSGEG